MQEGSMKQGTTQKRLRILALDEIQAIYGRPRFTYEERQEYFSLSPTELTAMEQLHSIKSRVYFILQLGYFKARQLFFAFSLEEASEDARYIMEQYFPNFQFTDFEITKVTRLKQQRLILKLYNYRSCNTKERQKLETKAQQAAMVCSKPIYIFREMIHYLQEERIVTPVHSFLQDTVGKALTEEQNRLISIVRHHLTPSDIEALKALLSDSQGLYEITLLKREPKDFSIKEIGREISRRKQIQQLYCLAKKLLPYLKISNESVRYYASLVNYYSVFRLNQLSEWVVYLYLLCFIYHRYQRIHDNLLLSLIYDVRRYTDEAKAAAKERVYQYRIEANQDLQKAGQVLKLFTNDRIAEQTPFHQVKAKAFSILQPQKLDFIADHIAKKVRFDETAFQWEQIDKLANQYKRHLRPIFKTVGFAASQAQDSLIEAVDFLKEAFGKRKSLRQYSPQRFPVQFIPDKIKRYLYRQDNQGQKRFLPDRYEFLVYRLLRNGLEAGDIFCRDSVRFRSFEDDLVDDEKWQQKEKLMADTSLTILIQPIQEHLKSLEQILEERITKVNQRIISGENKHFQIKQQGKQNRWTLQYPRASEPVNHPFFDTLKQVDIGDVMHFVNQQCRFMAAFEHVLGRYTKPERDDHALTAALVAWATNTGLYRMAEISDMEYHILAAVSDNFIRLETLSEANDRVSDDIAKLPIFQYFNLGDALHSSSDGQKFESQIPTINARHSSKYFGLKKGIVSYTLVANHVPLNVEVIGANDHESHYVFDLLYNNTTDIQPEVHSTDTQGTNEVNFAILHLFGYQFAPRYKDIYDEVSQSLYGFKHPSQYGDLIIKPIRKINLNLIIEEWENMQRIMVSLALKTTTQSIIVGKLSNHARKNKTKRALWEYDNIIKTLYLLDYIDSPPLRRNVQQALNRGENYHQLRRAVSYANFGKLRFKNEYQQQIWNECARLITNCIIYYNATILSHMLSHKETTGDGQGAEMLKQVSPVAWKHINLHGRYEFRKRTENININAIIQELAKVPIKQDLAE
jgi:TnpA family transposase